jgi:type IV pilus assembly protein PilV
MEWSIMELMRRNKNRRAANNQEGLTIIELMIAMFVLAVGILGSMSLVIMAINGDFRSKQESNSTALAQMVTEKIMSIPAWNNSPLTITDCIPTDHSVSTTGSSTLAGAGAALTSSGDVDYTQAKVTNYNMAYTDCGTQNREMTYDVRWNIKTIANNSYIKVLTVSARLNTVRNGATSGSVFGPVVTIKTIVGQGT